MLDSIICLSLPAAFCDLTLFWQREKNALKPPSVIATKLSNPNTSHSLKRTNMSGSNINPMTGNVCALTIDMKTQVAEAADPRIRAFFPRVAWLDQLPGRMFSRPRRLSHGCAPAVPAPHKYPGVRVLRRERGPEARRRFGNAENTHSQFDVMSDLHEFSVLERRSRPLLPVKTFKTLIYIFFTKTPQTDR